MTDHPISTVYLDEQIARANAVLTAAWDVAPLELLCGGFSALILTFAYTPGAGGGAFDWQMQTSLFSIGRMAAGLPAGAPEWTPESLIEAQAIVAGTDAQSLAQRAYQTYQATAVALETFVVGPAILARGIERVRIVARESGVPGTPGTLQIEAKFTVG